MSLAQLLTRIVAMLPRLTKLLTLELTQLDEVKREQAHAVSELAAASQRSHAELKQSQRELRHAKAASEAAVSGAKVP
eukprot:523855-Rhodomonas_salina.2